MMSVFKDLYGQTRFLRVNVHSKSMEVFDRTPARHVPLDIGIENVIPPTVSVLHGHFSYHDVAHIIRLHDIPVITWVRDPVERIISYYYYMQRNIRDGTWPNAQHLRDVPFSECIKNKGHLNGMSSFLKGLPLEEYRFIGVTEYYEQDLNDLAYIMNWDRAHAYYLNTTTIIRSEIGPISESDRKMARRLYSEDVELYRKVLRLRRKRRKTLGDISNSLATRNLKIKNITAKQKVSSLYTSVRHTYKRLFKMNSFTEKELLRASRYFNLPSELAAEMQEKIIIDELTRLSDEDFVRTLYYIILYREPDFYGFQAYVNALKSGGSREKIIDELMFSDEYKKKKTQ